MKEIHAAGQTKNPCILQKQCGDHSQLHQMDLDVQPMRVLQTEGKQTKFQQGNRAGKEPAERKEV